MLTHENYYEIEAETHYELGMRRGELFGGFLRESIEWGKREKTWDEEVARAGRYVAAAQHHFPHLVEEVHGYAEAARVCFEETWRMIVEDEIDEFDGGGRCSTIITNNGTLVAHNEDWWEEDAEYYICLLKSTVGNYSKLELSYYNTLGGNSVSVNSHGYVQAINSLAHDDHQFGVPRNLVCRWFSDTKNPEKDFQRLGSMKRASGYHHNLLNGDGRIVSVETSATKQVMRTPNSPFVHTNHYLTDLKKFESREPVRGTKSRYQCAIESVSPTMSIDRARYVLGDTSKGSEDSLFNDWTVARVIVDLESKNAHIWLRRESQRGWITYPLNEIIL